MHLDGVEGNGARAVSDAQIRHVTEAAISWWDQHADLSDQQLAMLHQTSVRIEDLGYDSVNDENGTGWMLGLTSDNAIAIDDDAAGHGWSLGLGGVAKNKVDLFSVLVHEMGHVIGKTDADMGSTLAVGQRLLPSITAPEPEDSHALMVLGSTMANVAAMAHVS